MPQKLLI